MNIFYTECPSSSYSFGGFFLHMQQKHTELTTVLCHGCNLTMTDIKNLVEHLENCCRIFKYNCLLCKFGASETNGIADHYLDNHPSNSMIFCEREQIVPPSENPDDENYIHLPIRFVKLTVSRH